MPATHSQIAEAVKDALNAASVAGAFSETFTARRLYLTLDDLPEVVGAGVNVIVAAASSERAALTRARGQKDVTVHVGIFRKLPAGVAVNTEAAAAQLDPMADFAEAVADFFGPGFAAGDAQWVRTSTDPIYDPDRLHDLRVFASLVAVTFKTDTAYR